MDAMLVTTRRMWVASTGALLFNDPVSFDLEETDDEVDEFERRIRSIVKDHVVSAPRAEIQLSLAVLSVVQDAERIGDLTKSLGALALQSAKPLIGPSTVKLRQTREEITQMFDDTRAGFVEGVVERGQDAMNRNERIKPDLRRFLAELSNESDVTTNEAVLLSVAALNMGRVSSHLSNIASTVVLPFEDIRGSLS